MHASHVVNPDMSRKDIEVFVYRGLSNTHK